jgi:hypothetical protein
MDHYHREGYAGFSFSSINAGSQLSWFFIQIFSRQVEVYNQGISG